MRVAPKHTPYTATQITEGNIVELAQKHSRELYITPSFRGIDWDADTIVGPRDWIITNTAGTPIDVCTTQELRDNYIIGEEK